MKRAPPASEVDHPGQPCGRLASVERPNQDKPSLASLRGAFFNLPDATYGNFRDIRTVWEPRAPESGDSNR